MDIQTLIDLAKWVNQTVHKWPTYHLMSKSPLKQILWLGFTSNHLTGKGKTNSYLMFIFAERSDE